MTNFTDKANSLDKRNGWRWGFTSESESWNGRLAMLGFASVLIIEAVSGQGILHFSNLL